MRLLQSGLRWRRRSLLLPLVIVLALVVTGTGLWLLDVNGSASPGASVSPSGSVGPSRSAAPIAPQRPYTDDSAWNIPIGPDPAIDANSGAFVATIAEAAGGGVLTSDPTQYSYPVYEADADTPRYDLPCTWYKCMITHPGEEPERVETLEDVPIPLRAQPSAGSDGSMIIIDVETGTEYDLWKVERDGDSWSVGNGSIYNIEWDGMPEIYGSRGAGLPYLAGLVRHAEIAAGRIDHAIAFAYPSVAAAGCVWPASKTDGASTSAYALPEGARLQLDPALTDEDFVAMGLNTAARVIARALQEYGMILIDGSGRAKIIVEDLSANPYTTESWSEPPTQVTESTISAIPVDAFRLLALPSGYVSGQDGGARHGECYR